MSSANYRSLLALSAGDEVAQRQDILECTLEFPSLLIGLRRLLKPILEFDDGFQFIWLKA